MHNLKKDEWQYATLLVVLFAIASISTKTAIDYITPLVGDTDRLIVTAILCTLTLGLMSISAAFALWVINFETKTRSAQRIGDIVSRMSYIKDGVLAVNSRGKIVGMNPAAIKLLNIQPRKKYILQEICPELGKDNINLLLNSPQPVEIESKFGKNERWHTFRFRSQSSKSTTIIFINDVTKLADDRTRRRQAAYLQLIGHIAQGIANDFNNILCGISGHASLISRPNVDAKLIQQSAMAINDSANRGIQLVGSLLELSNTSSSSETTAMDPAKHINNAIDAIIDNLHASWEIIRNISEDIPPINITGLQVEHIVLGIGMLSTDIYNKDRKLSIQLSPHTDAGICHAEEDCAAVLIITPTDIGKLKENTLTACPTTTTGTIQSVVSSIIKQCGGKMECFSSDGIPLYRILLPHASLEQIDSQQATLPLGLEAYIEGWKILLCNKNNKFGKTLVQYLNDCKVETMFTHSIVEVLTAIEHSKNLHAIIIQASTLGSDQDGLLRAINKLCPTVGIVVIDNNAAPEPHSSIPAVIRVPHSYSPAHIAQAMIEARTRARSKQTS